MIHILDIRNAILEIFKEIKVFNKIRCNKKESSNKQRFSKSSD
jgi:hypothetical protein